MKKKLIEHLAAVIFVVIVFIIFLLLSFNRTKNDIPVSSEKVKELAELPFLDYDRGLDRLLLKETLNVFYPGRTQENEKLFRAVEEFRSEKIAGEVGAGQRKDKVTVAKLFAVLGMYIRFIFVYILVMLLTYYGVQTLALLRFIRMKQNNESYLRRVVNLFIDYNFQANTDFLKTILIPAVKMSLKALVKGLFYFILFAPAYVIAYSIKTRFDTNSLLFMVLLGAISNGLLVTYAQKFYTFLVHESRKGYVETAVVKNLNNSFAFTKNHKTGILWKSVFAIRKHFPGHILQHIYINARFQYLSTLKEQASFLITGLIIIEMALNIQNHLCYELLQNILYQNYSIAALIVFGIFLVVKATEIVADWILEREIKKYENA